MSVLEDQKATEPEQGPKKRGPRHVTKKMIIANQLNSKRSRGPSKEGCKVSCRNATRHGMASKKIMFMPGENPDDFWDQVARSVKDLIGDGARIVALSQPEDRFLANGEVGIGIGDTD